MEVGTTISRKCDCSVTSLVDDNSELEPPDPIPNSEVKRLSADGSVGLPHVRVGHRQPFNTKPLSDYRQGFFAISVSSLFLVFTASSFQKTS